jgi:uncharacterized protein involved in exopolysaccharide biosynthesis
VTTDSDTETVRAPTRSVGGARWIVGQVVVVLLCVAVVAVAVGAAAYLRPTSYDSTAKVLYGRDSSSLLSGVVAPDEDVTRILATQSEIVQGDSVMVGAAEDLGLSTTRLRDYTEVEGLPESNVIAISVSGSSAAEAQQRTQRVANGYVRYSRDLAQDTLTRQAESVQPLIDRLTEELRTQSQRERSIDSSTQQTLSQLVQRRNQLTSAAAAEEGPAAIISAAEEPTGPSSVSVPTAAALGGGTGLVLGIGLVLLLQRGRRSRTG